MRVKCPKCLTVQRLKRDLEPGELRRISCENCNTKFSVRNPRGKAPTTPPKVKDTPPDPAATAMQPTSDVSQPTAENQNISSSTEAANLSGTTGEKPEPMARWRVTKVDGTHVEFPDLQLFQKWVIDGRITVADSISRNGNDWRVIGDVPEFVGLFERATTQAAAQAADIPAVPDVPEEQAHSIDIDSPPPTLPPEPLTQPNAPDELPYLPPGVTIDSTETEVPAELLPGSAEFEHDPDAQTMIDLSLDDQSKIELPDPVELPDLDSLPDIGGIPSIPELPAAVPSLDSAVDLDDIPGIPESLVTEQDPLAELPTLDDQPKVEKRKAKKPPGEVTSMMMAAMDSDELGSFVDLDNDAGLAGIPASASDLGGLPPGAMDLIAELPLQSDVQPLGDSPLTESQEMALAGATLEISAPDKGQFDLGNALDLGLSNIGGQADPNNLPMPGEIENEPGDAPQAPQLDPEKNIQPVAAMPQTRSASSEIPLTVDETGNLGMGWLAKAVVGFLLIAVVVIAVFLFQFFKQNAEDTGDSSPSPNIEARESSTEPATSTASTANESVKTDAPPVPDDSKGPRRFAEKPQRRDSAKQEGNDAAKKLVAAAAKDKSPKVTKTPKAAKNEKPKATTGKPAAASTKKQPSKVPPKTEKAEVEVKEPDPPRPPDSYDGLMAAARTALKNGSPKRSLAYLREAARLNPRSVEPIAKMGWAYLRMNNASLAILKFTEAKQKNPGYRNSYVGLAKAFEKAGRVHDAIASYRTYLRLCPNCRRTAAVKAALMRIGAAP